MESTDAIGGREREEPCLGFGAAVGLLLQCQSFAMILSSGGSATEALSLFCRITGPLNGR